MQSLEQGEKGGIIQEQPLLVEMLSSDNRKVSLWNN